MTPLNEQNIPLLRRVRVRLALSLIAISVLPFLIASATLLASMPKGSGGWAQTIAISAVLAAVCAFAALKLADAFLGPLHEIRHGAEIISKINLSHRIKLKTGDEFQALADDFNEMAESLEGAYGELEARVRQVTLNLQDEKGRLATVLRTMVEGVIVISEAGEVTLMNPRARMALAGGPELVVGTPLNRILPKGRVDYYLRKLRQSWEEGGDVVLSVLFPMAGGKLLKGVMTAMPGQGGERSGFLLAFRDITDEAARENLIETSLRTLPSKLKSPLSSVQSLAEILETRKTLPEDKREAFTTALRKEVEGCLGLLAEGESAEARMPSARWQGEPADPVSIVQEALASKRGVYSHFNPPVEALPPVAAEPYGAVAAICAILNWLSSNSNGWTPIEASLEAGDEMVVATFRLAQESGPNPDELASLMVVEEGEEAVPLAEAVHRNRGEVWTRAAEGAFEVRLGMVRASQLPEHSGGVRILDDQPEFYDFDLFLPRSGAEGKELLDRPLRELELVVFDTETTGLKPLKGDKIVSLSAVRIRKGKIVAAGNFDALVNPGIAVPKESTAFHGLTDADLSDAPPVSEMYKSFQQYIGGAVLVAHNAAFDMKFLEIAAKENSLVQLDNPVLDTLFLSYGVHGELEGHNLEAIASRLGVTIEGRHTAGGDAMATAEIFVKLIPLLEARGIATLGQAKAYCDSKLILRWQTSRF